MGSESGDRPERDGSGSGGPGSDDSRAEKINALSAAVGVFLAVLAFFGISRFTDLSDLMRPDGGRPSASVGSSSPVVPQPVGPSLSAKEKYVRAADQVCMKWSRAVAELDDSTPSLALFNGLIDITTSMAMEWGALTPPPGDRGEADVFVEKLNRDVELFQAARDRWVRGDSGWRSEIDAREKEESEVDRRAAARAYGFRVCW